MNSINIATFIFLLVTIIITYFTPKPIEIHYNKHKNFILNKLYISIYFSLVITITEIVLRKNSFTSNEFYVWIFILLLFSIFVFYAIKKQLNVSNMDYIYEIGENINNDMNLAETVLNKNMNDDELKNLVNILKINRMNELKIIDDIINKKNIK